MAIPGTDVVAPIAGVLDRIIPDQQARDAAKLELLRLDRHELTNLYAAMTGARTPTSAADRWSTRARPSFLYVMYALLLTGRVYCAFFGWLSHATASRARPNLSRCGGMYPQE